MKRLWITAVTTLAMSAAPGVGAFAQIDMSQGQGPVLTNRNQGPRPDCADGTTIPMGSEIKGHVSDVQRGMRSQLLLSFDEIKTRHGWVPLAAMVAGVPGEHSVQTETGPEGEIKHSKVDARREVESAAAGAAIGAIVGATAGGGKGAAIGAGVGGGLGTGAGLLTGRNIRLNKGQMLDLRLERDIFLPRR
jgi:hypothetical protein